jgi:hypothetical protein
VRQIKHTDIEQATVVASASTLYQLNTDHLDSTRTPPKSLIPPRLVAGGRGTCPLRRRDPLLCWKYSIDLPSVVQSARCTLSHFRL